MEYVNEIIKFSQTYPSSIWVSLIAFSATIIFLIVRIIRKRNLHKSNGKKDTVDVTRIENNNPEISNCTNSNIQEDINDCERNDNSNTVMGQTPSVKRIKINEDTQIGVNDQIEYDNGVISDTLLNEPESNNEPENIEVEINPHINSDEKIDEDDQLWTISQKRRIPCKDLLKNDIDELLQKINRIFKENKLLGNYDFTEDEYSELLDNVGLLCNSLLSYGNVFDDKHHKLIFTSLVEIAKRWKDSDSEDVTEENSRFWDYMSKHIINEDIINQKLYHAFTDVISQLEMNDLLPVVSKGKKYYSTLMMHSFAPRNSIFSFYDLCYNIFKNDLDFGFTNDDEWQCEKFATEIANFLGRGYREDKNVTIGSSVYSIKIGLRSFALNENLFIDFVEFIKDTLIHINKLFYREPINENTRLKRYIGEWWKNKTESIRVFDDSVRKRRVPTVSKENIVAKYIRDENSVFLYIPSIRLDNDDIVLILNVFVKEMQIHSEVIKTKRGELVVSTKQIEKDLNDLLRCYDSIDLRVEIKENQTIIFDSERSKVTSLKREFILFEGEKEVLSQINKPTNYFIYSKNIDALKRIPVELTTYGPNLYNIYPLAGESIIGDVKQIFFVDKIKTASIGKTPCLIGGVQNAEWFLDDISCIVYSGGVKLLIPDNINLKALELRIDNKAHKLHELGFERIESGCYQFGLKAMGLIPENNPTEIILYSYERKLTILSETIIVLPNLKIQFNHPFYYGELERKLTLYTGDEALELTWSKQENEIKCPVKDGMLLIKIAYLRWKINNEWHNEPINKKIWYKDFLANGDILEIDNPKENDEIKVIGKLNGNTFEIVKNQNGNFEIGRAIYANEGITDIPVHIVLGKEVFEIFTVSTKEHFIENPLTYNDGKVFWNPEDTFIGDESNEFFLIIKSADNNYRSKVNYKKSEIYNQHDDICKIQIKIKDKNIFSKAENYQLIYEGELLIGTPEKIRFKNKKIMLLSANCFDSKKSEWIPFIPKYFIDKLKFVQEDINIYYTGQLCERDCNGETRVISTMINEKGTYDKTNPVRIELRDNNTLWLVAGWEGGNDFIGNLFCDKIRRGICNIQKQDNYFGEINLYKFKEEDYV